MMRLFKFLALLAPFGAVAMIVASEEKDRTVDLQPYEVKSYWLEPGKSEDETSTLSHATIGQHRSADIATLLKQASPEVDIIRKAGTSNDIVIRGLSQDNLTVTIDDGKVFPCCSNRMDPPVSQVSTAMIETIELTQGAFDLSEAGSMGGSVKITTKEPSATEQFQSVLYVASFEQMNVSVHASGGNQDLSGVFVAEYGQSKAYEDGDGNRLTDMPDSSAWAYDDYLELDRDMTVFKAVHSSAKAQWQLDETTYIKGTYRYRKDEDVLYPGLRMDADLTETHEFGVFYVNENIGNTDTEFSVHLNHNWTDHDMRDSHRKSSILNASNKARPQYVLDRGWFMESLATGSTTGLQATLSSDGLFLNWESGVEYTQRKWDINNRLGAGMPTSGPQAEIFNDMIPDTVSTITGLFAQGEYWIGDSSRLDFGIRLDHFETEAKDPTAFLLSQMNGDASKNEWMPSGKIVFRYDLTEDVSWFAGIGSTVRIPNGQERYIQLQKAGTSANWLGNPDLKSPRNTELISGISINNEKMRFNAKAFYSRLDDYIYTGKMTPDQNAQLAKTTQSYFNIEAELYGLDTSVTYYLTDDWSVYGGVAWQKGRKRTSIINNASENLGEIPPIKGMAIVAYSPGAFELSIESIFADKQSNIDPYIGEIEIADYAVFNLRGRYFFDNGFVVAVGVENIADTTYASHNSLVRNPFSTFTVVNEPGRIFYLSVNMNW